MVNYYMRDFFVQMFWIDVIFTIFKTCGNKDNWM